MPTIFAEFNRQKPCRYGLMLFNQYDSYIGRSLDLYGEYCEDEVRVFSQIVRPGMTVVEVGANIGSHTLFLARQAGPQGRVYAYEPQRIVFQTLCANMAINSIPNVHAFQLALGDAPGSVLIPPINYTQENNFGGLSLGNWEAGEEVAVTTLDSFHLAQCHFIKIDVEGMEQQVLAGAVETIHRHRPILYVENDKVEKSDALIRYLDSLGYQMYWHSPYYFSPNNFYANPNNVFPNLLARNMLCVHSSLKHDLTNFQPVLVPPAESTPG